MLEIRSGHHSSESDPVLFTVPDPEVVSCEIVLRPVLYDVVDKGLRSVLSEPLVECRASLR